MKPTFRKRRFSLLLLLILMIGFVLTKTSIGSVILASPWWIYLVIIGIFISGYMTVKYTLEDKRYDDEWIEEEGNIYMRRIEQEKEKRNKKGVSRKAR